MNITNLAVATRFAAFCGGQALAAPLVGVAKTRAGHNAKWFSGMTGAIVRSPKAAVGVASAALFVAVMSGPVQAAVVQGSGGIITNRPCPDGPAACVVGFNRLQPHQYFGGYGQGFSSSTISLNNGASGSVAASFGADYLPTVRVGSVAGADTRTGGSATAFQSFTYDGSLAIDLAISGQLHFFTSGDVAGPFGADEFAGDGSLNVAFGLMRVSDLTSVISPSSTGQDIVSSVSSSFADCNSGALAAGGYNSSGLQAGEHTVSIGLSSRCGGGAIRINPGDSFVVFATLQAISNRSGFLDATQTFSVQYDEQNTFFADTQNSVGAGFLNSNITQGAAVPEPSTWAMMIIGFGAAGSMIRRRKAVVA